MKYAILLTAFAVLIVAICFVACSKSKQETPTNPSSEKFVDVNEDNNGDTIHVLPGEIIRITLRSNPSTGFFWALGPFEEQGLETNGESEFVA
ncbi:MAG: protease inhibitor I42 family protein, partial [Lentisphaeria bacterium]|nr:protease inhibitor I42 family protein [Lentisphaeria bacterium]